MPRLLRSILSISGVNVVNGILGLLAVPIGLRCIGVQGYGLLAIYGVLASYITLSDLGISKNLLRNLAASRQETDRILYLRTALSVYLGLGLVLLVSTPLLAWTIPRCLFSVPSDSVSAAQWITAAAVLEYVLGIPASMMQTACISRERFDRVARFNLFSGLNRYSLLIAAFLIFRSPVAAAASQALRKIVDYWLAQRILGPLPSGSSRPCRGSIRTMLADSTILSVAQLLYLSTIQVPALLVNWTFGLHTLGIYRAVYDLAAKIFFFGNVTGLVLFPKFARTSEDDSLSQTLPAVLRASWSFYAAVACAASAVTPFALPLLGLQNEAALVLFPMICLGLCLNAHGIVSTEAMQGGRLWTQMMSLCLITLAVLAGSFYAAAEALGIAAIGAAWIMSQAVFVLLADQLVLRSRANQPADLLALAAKAGILVLTTAAAWPGFMSGAGRMSSFVFIFIAFVYSVSPLLRRIPGES